MVRPRLQLQIACFRRNRRHRPRHEQRKLTADAEPSSRRPVRSRHVLRAARWLSVPLAARGTPAGVRIRVRFRLPAGVSFLENTVFRCALQPLPILQHGDPRWICASVRPVAMPIATSCSRVSERLRQHFMRRRQLRVDTEQQAGRAQRARILLRHARRSRRRSVRIMSDAAPRAVPRWSAGQAHGSCPARFQRAAGAAGQRSCDRSRSGGRRQGRGRHRDSQPPACWSKGNRADPAGTRAQLSDSRKEQNGGGAEM